jgi:hypothetical protein
MSLEEENQELRKVLAFATRAITMIPVMCMVPTSYFPQIEKLVEKIDKMTPKPQP